MPDLAYAVLLATLAGASIPVGAWLAGYERIIPGKIRNETNHWILAFGAGALLSAVALVLVPEGLERVHGVTALAPVILGALAALGADLALSRSGGSKAQFVAMLLDFVPEAIALGAIVATEPNLALLLAALIAAQNLPEGFNAKREMVQTTSGTKPTSNLLFLALVPIGPIAAVLGMTVFAGLPQILGWLMLFAAGGILYLMFQDIAPEIPTKRHWTSPLGAILGFCLGLGGHILAG